MVNISGWGGFRLGDLFPIIYKAEAHVKTDLTECEHSNAKAIPFISRTENDNGCDCFVENDGSISGIEEGNSIFDVQALLDHDNVTTTQLYAAHKRNTKRALIDRFEWLDEFEEENSEED